MLFLTFKALAPATIHPALRSRLAGAVRLAVWLSLVVVLLGLGSLPVSAETPQDDKNKKEQKKIREYQKDVKELIELKEYGVKKYTGKEEDDLEFRAQVNRAFAELKRGHQLQAFQINTRAPLRVLGELEGEGGNNAARNAGAQAAMNGVEALYDNPMLQDYVSRIGQALVPRNSKKLYAFRILQDPLPRAESLSTGTIYLSTGLIGLLDNEAQLAYIISHEIAHVEAEHWFYKAMLPLALEEKNQDKEKKRQKISLLTALAGAAIGAKTGGAEGALQGSYFGYGMGHAASDLFIRNLNITEWDIADEDEADRYAFANTINHFYDVQEIPKLYSNLRNAVVADSRVGLGFMSSLQHVEERNQAIGSLLGQHAQLIQQLASQGKLYGSHSDFEVLMAELKRDNGVVAFYYDMFDMTRRNLEWSLRIRTDDAKAHYYLGRVLKLTARTPEEKDRAQREFIAAHQLDDGRGSMPGIHLQLALALMDLRDPNKNGEIAGHLKEYIRLYKVNNGGSVPPNMDILYDYLGQVGDKNWFMPPTNNISTQDVAPVVVKTNLANAVSEAVPPPDRSAKPARPPGKP
ncbi:MAG: M48 family metalloprotease [Blastocatellia bacterium]|nr:M48 family metalloprotease [Blastocatellia bacterium]